MSACEGAARVHNDKQCTFEDHAPGDNSQEQHLRHGQEGQRGSLDSRPELLLLRSELETCHAKLCCSCHLLPLFSGLLLRSGLHWRLVRFALLAPAITGILMLCYSAT